MIKIACPGSNLHQLAYQSYGQMTGRQADRPACIQQLSFAVGGCGVHRAVCRRHPRQHYPQQRAQIGLPHLCALLLLLQPQLRPRLLVVCLGEYIP